MSSCRYDVSHDRCCRRRGRGPSSTVERAAGRASLLSHCMQTAIPGEQLVSSDITSGRPEVERHSMLVHGLTVVASYGGLGSELVSEDVSPRLPSALRRQASAAIIYLDARAPLALGRNNTNKVQYLSTFPSRHRPGVFRQNTTVSQGRPVLTVESVLGPT
jgi:hypothetical protein